MACLKEIISVGIVQRDATVVQHFSSILLNHRNAVMCKTKRAKAQEVHFQTSHFFTLRPLQLCCPFQFSGLFVRHFRLRHIFCDSRIADQFSACVQTLVHFKSFNSAGEINDFCGTRIRIVKGSEFRHICKCALDCHMRSFRHQSGKTVSFFWRKTENTDDAADSVAGCCCSEGDNAAHMICSVFCPAVFDNPVSSGIFKVGINIRHGNAVRIQEPFKQEVVL